MKFNDYIGTTLRDVLRPYDLIAMPESIGLTLYCDFNLLVSWYASLLILEMTTRVDSVVEVLYHFVFLLNLYVFVRVFS